jgi:ammonia channel protein AmtB
MVNSSLFKKPRGENEYYLFILREYSFFYTTFIIIIIIIYYNSALIKKKLKGILVNHLLLCAWIYFYYELKQWNDNFISANII